MFFYKGKSKSLPSQSMTAIGILEDVQLAHSTKDLFQMTGGRSVYSEQDLQQWQASKANPVKVINYLLAAYIEPAIELKRLQEFGILGAHPPQSIYKIAPEKLGLLLSLIDLSFAP